MLPGQFAWSFRPGGVMHECRRCGVLFSNGVTFRVCFTCYVVLGRDGFLNGR